MTYAFKYAYDKAQYGYTAVETGRQTVITSRKYGTTKVLVDLTTSNGTKIQWPLYDVSKRLSEAK